MNSNLQFNVNWYTCEGDYLSESASLKLRREDFTIANLQDRLEESCWNYNKSNSLSYLYGSSVSSRKGDNRVNDNSYRVNT